MSTTEVASLAGQVAVITGAGRGIGRALAQAYAAAGMRVVCSARSTDQIESTAQAINDAGGLAAAVACDVLVDTQVEALMTAATHLYGGIDLVVVNAGMSAEYTHVADANLAEWRQVLDLNLNAAMTQCHFAIPHLRARGGGKLLLMGSGMARNAVPGASAYACSKAGLGMLNRILAQELRSDNIAVNEVVPGPVRTQLTGVPDEREGDDADGADILRVPGEWTKNPSDVAPLGLYLASLPNHGPTGQSYSLAGRDLGRI